MTSLLRPSIVIPANAGIRLQFYPEASDVKVTSKNHRGGAPSHYLRKAFSVV